MNSFDLNTKKVKIEIYTQEVVDLMDELYGILGSSAECLSIPKTQLLDDVRKCAQMKINALKRIGRFTDRYKNELLNLALTTVMLNFDFGITLKFWLAYVTAPMVILSNGTEKHRRFIENFRDYKEIGAFCLTEVEHGSNVKKMQTTAKYDPKSKQFVLHTPNFQSAKCWAGVLGHSSTLAIIFAQLITPDNSSKGLHTFLVPLRDPSTLEPYPGITIGDMGEKSGMNAIDNGFVIFDNYKIPKESLLNKYHDVTDEGKYIKADYNSGNTVNALIQMRFGMVITSHVLLTKAVTIGIRFAFDRKSETCLFKLMPSLASAYVFKVLQDEVHAKYAKFAGDFEEPEKWGQILSVEAHALSAACKVMSSWSSRDRIRDCMDVINDYSYLRASVLIDLRNDHDITCTIDGENHVLIQQTSNILQKLYLNVLNQQNFETPFQSMEFFKKSSIILSKKWAPKSIEELEDLDYIIEIYEWLTLFLIKSSYAKFHRLKSTGMSSFTSKNETQVFHFSSSGIAYVQLYALNAMKRKISKIRDPAIKVTLRQIACLYGLFNLEKHFLSQLYRGGFAERPEVVTMLEETVMKFNKKVGGVGEILTDVIAPPDFLLLKLKNQKCIPGIHKLKTKL